LSGNDEIPEVLVTLEPHMVCQTDKIVQRRSSSMTAAMTHIKMTDNVKQPTKEQMGNFSKVLYGRSFKDDF
jgi:hypothetical protein